MKKFKKFVALMAATAMMIALPTGNVLTASAAEPTTYLAYYNEQEEEWIYQVGVSAYNEEEDEEDIDDLADEIKSGDILVIDGSDSFEGISLNLGNIHLTNLTILKADIAIVAAGSIDECHVLDDAVASITGTIKNAYVYDDAIATFINDIAYLEVIGVNDLQAHVTCDGTVGHLKGICEGTNIPDYEYYNIAKDELVIENGCFETKEGFYSTTPSASAPSATPSAPAQSNTSSNTNSGDYDAVPKTGEAIPAYIVLLCIAAICFAGKCALKRA